MPIYEFDCEACGHEFEKRMSFDDPRPRKCPECGKLKLKKRINAPQLHMRYSPMHPHAMRGQRGPVKPRRKP